MEEETKRVLVRHLKAYVMDSVDLPTDIMDTMDPKKKLQEWDGVIFLNGVLYLLEAKHDMSPDKIRKLDGRVASFCQVVASSARKDVFSRYVKGQIVGVTGGTEAVRLGVWVIDLSGLKYQVSGEPRTDKAVLQ
ncbi:hypothetical protein BC830DRAFT_1243747 [Chytriomyces sp. MP71]|nr:hypothetical protein BC830DRAFT_1243747 [Chytriomyces sp. MP71]